MTFIPGRNDIVWLDFEPSKGKKIGKYRPALVLSSKEYSKSSGLIICCPISTSIRNLLTEVAITNLEQPSVAVCSLIQTMDYRNRKVKLITKAEKGVMEQVLDRLLPLIAGDQYLSGIALSRV